MLIENKPLRPTVHSPFKLALHVRDLPRDDKSLGELMQNQTFLCCALNFCLMLDLHVMRQK